MVPPSPASLRRVRGRQEDVQFAGGTGAPLAGVLHLPPDVAPRGGVLLAHCFTCGKDLLTSTRLARGLTAAGWAVLRFDFTGLGESGGDFTTTTISTSLADLDAAAGVLAERAGGPLGMVGHSYGGAAVLLAAERRDDVGSVAVLGAPSRAAHLTRLIDSQDGRHSVTVGERCFDLDDDFVADLHRQDLDRCLARLDRPLLVLHGLADRVVPVEEGEALFAAARQPKAFLPLLGADHLLTDRAVAGACVDALDAWFAHTLRS